MSHEGTLSWYKSRWVAKDFEQRQKIDTNRPFFLGSLQYQNIIRPSRILQLIYQASGGSNSLTQFESCRSFLCWTSKQLSGSKQGCLIKKSYLWLETICLPVEEKSIYPVFKGGLDSASIWLFSLHANPGIDKIVIVIVYIDDFLEFGPEIKQIESVKRWLAAHYKIIDLGSCSQFIGIKNEMTNYAPSIYHKRPTSIGNKLLQI